MSDKQDVQNSLFKAISTIATKIVENKNFDETKECTIIEVYLDNNGNKTGKYKVKHQNAVFDAYAKQNETYSQNQCVYVQIPNGDMEKQKFILGVKIDVTDDNPVYNFQLPLDNFIGLYSLTEYNPLTAGVGYWANCPVHGIQEEINQEDLIWSWKIDYVVEFEEQLLTIYNQILDAAKANNEIKIYKYSRLYPIFSCIYNDTIQTVKKIVRDNTIDEDSQTNKINQLIERYSLVLTDINAASEIFSLSEDEINNQINGEDGFKPTFDKYRASLVDEANLDPEDEINLYATHLGIEVDVTSLLYGYLISSGSYGLRIRVSGIENTEEGKSSTFASTEYLFTDKNMYGNPYAYSSGSTQQALFDVSQFLQIQKIDIYFWQDHNFKDEVDQLIPWGSLSEEVLEQEQLLFEQEQQEIANSALTNEEKEQQQADLLLRYINKINSLGSAEKNLLFNNLNVLLGIDVTNKNEQAIIYTYNSTIFGEDPDHAEVRAAERTLRLAWVHKIGNGLQVINSAAELAQFKEDLKAEVYWYRYDESWTSSNLAYNKNNKAHTLGGAYWSPYIIKKDDSYCEYGGHDLTQVVIPDISKNKERYKVVIYYSGTHITSDVLIFNNCNNPEDAASDLARNNKVILRCSKFVKDENDNLVLTGDDSIGDFYVYNENNEILTDDDNKLFSEVIYFIEPWIRVVDQNGEFATANYYRLSEYTNIDGKYLIDTSSIDWQMPENGINYNMIQSFGAINDSFKSEYEFFNLLSDEQFERYKKTMRWFYIKPTYNNRYSDNTISAEIDLDGYGVFTIKKTLQFGRAASFGCEYTPVITILEPAGNYYIDMSAPFRIGCSVYNRNGQLVDAEVKNTCLFTWSFIGNNVSYLEEFELESYNGFSNNVIVNRLRQLEPFIVQVTVTGAAQYPITVRKGIMVSNNAQYMQTHNIICPDRVEFKSDGQSPIYYNASFEVTEIDYANQDVIVYPSWKINQTTVLNLLFKNKEYPTFVLPGGTVVNHELENTEYSLALSQTRLNSDTTTEVAYGQQWSEDLLKPEYFTYIYYDCRDDDSSDSVYVAQAIAFAQNVYPSSLVNEWDGESLSIDKDNNAILAKMIAAGTKASNNNTFTGVMMGDWQEKGDESLDVAGLYGFRNGQQSFGLKVDGTGFIGPSGQGRIQFDGRNALISNSTQTCYINLNPRNLSENYKRYEDGTFVLADADGLELQQVPGQSGQWVAIDPATGIDKYDSIIQQDPETLRYWYSNGGTMEFLNLKFVLLKSAWDGIGNQSISQYFLYCETPVQTNALDQSGNLTDNFWWHESSWAKPYLNAAYDNDNPRDFFLVDPNAGILTSGGIFARFGQIGNNTPWILHDNGLTQKNNYGTIFLGNPEKNPSSGYGIPNPSFTYNGAEIFKYKITAEQPDGIDIPSNFFSASFSNETGQIQTGIRADGYLYTKYAAIGGWYVNEGEIYATSEGFRKAIVRDENSDQEGYLQDDININAAGRFISFNQGKIVIDGANGWMGFSDTLGVPPTSSVHSLWIEGNDSTSMISFASGHSKIDGKNGTAYFANGQIVIDGTSAVMYCGIDTALLPQEQQSLYTEAVSSSAGTIYLANVKVFSESQNLPELNDIYKSQVSDINATTENNASTTDDSAVPITKFSDIWDDGSVGAGFHLTTRDSYVNGIVFYTAENFDSVFVPVFSGSLNTNSVPNRYITIMTNQQGNRIIEIALQSFWTRVGTITVTFIKNSNGNWTFNGEVINNLNDYGIELNAAPTADEQDEFNGFSNISLSFIVSVNNWLSAQPLYEYNYTSADLTSLTGSDRTIAASDFQIGDDVTFSANAKLDLSYDRYGFRFLIQHPNAEEEIEAASLLMPLNVINGYLYNWIIDAKSISVQNSVTVAGSLNATSIFMTEPLLNGVENVGSYALVATQVWVDRYIQDEVWPKIKTVNNAAAAAMKKARYALSQAEIGITTANEALQRCVDKIDWNMGDGRNDFYFYTVAGNELAHLFGATATHGHNITGTVNGGKITTKIAFGSGTTNPAEKEFTIFSSDDFSMTADGAGKINYSLKVAEATATGNFNIADTDFYRANAVSAVSIKAVSSGSASVHAEVTHPDDTTTDYDTSTLVLDTDQKLVTLGDSGASISVQDVYNAGWAAARSKYSCSWSGNTISVTGPPAEVDGTAVSATYKITVTVSCSVTAEESSITYTTNGTHSRSASASGSASATAKINGTAAATASASDSDTDSYTVTVKVPTTTSTT